MNIKTALQNAPVTPIFMHTVHTPIKRFYRIYNRYFSRRCVAGLVAGAIFCTTQQLHYPLADVAVLSSENVSDKKSIVHTSSLKEVFLCGIYKKKGLGLLGHNRKKETIEYV